MLLVLIKNNLFCNKFTNFLKIIKKGKKSQINPLSRTNSAIRSLELKKKTSFKSPKQEKKYNLIQNDMISKLNTHDVDTYLFENFVYFFFV